MTTPRDQHPCLKAKKTTEASTAKKRYSKPEFKHEKVFETMALACGKLSATQGQCRFNRKLS